MLVVIDRMYSEYLKKFPKSAKLRFSYAFFLLERGKNKKKALEELNIAEKLNPGFEE